MNSTFKEFYAKVAEMHRYLITQMPTLTKELMKCGSTEEAADMRFAMYHAQRLMEECKKKTNVLDAATVKAVAILWSQDPQNELNPQPVRTEYATFSPSVSEQPKLPTFKDNPTHYIEILVDIGVDEELAATGLIGLRWTEIKAYIEKCNEEGKPLPKSLQRIDETYPVYSCRVSHKKKEVLED